MRALPAALGAAVLLAGCGGGDGDAREALRETTAKLREIRSGEMALSVRLDGRGGDASAPIGFALEGPFSLPKGGGLPVARLSYTQTAGDQEATATFVSTGEAAFVEVGDQAYELEQTQAEGVVGRDPLGGLDLQRWVIDPEHIGTEERDGDETEHYRAGLDAVRALGDLGNLAAGAGADPAALEGETAERVREAFRDARIDIWTGAEDRLLRRLELRASVALDVPEQAREALGELVGGDIRLALELRRINTPVEVEAPANPRPASELPVG